jgi:ER-bound oxygenase mpaB/B'/Rubber oxygenase, catalytic domain
MGIMPAPGELDAIAHLTRYVGWLTGVEDEWLPRSFRESIRLRCHTSTALANPDETTQQMSIPMAEDPLAWHFRGIRGLRRRLAWAQHLSITSAFPGPSAMRVLGLPAYMPPWYPLLRMPVNLIRSGAAMALPGGMSRAVSRGRREQQALLHTMIGDGAANIGESAVHMSSVA